MDDEQDYKEGYEEERLGPASLKLRLQGRVAIYVLLVGFVAMLSSLGAFWFGISLVQTTVPLRTVLGVAIAQGILATMFVLFAELIGSGRVLRRQEAARPTSGGGVSNQPSAANRQSLIGLIGTIITAILAFLGVVVQVFVSGGGNGG